MTVIPPIHSSAILPIEFTPPHQDAERYKREATAATRTREQTVARRVEELAAAVERGDMDEEQVKIARAEISAEQDNIADQWPIIEAEYQAMKRRYPSPQIFFIAVPTSVERDQINSRLISLGLTQVTQEQIRATMIEELFHQDWSLPGEEITSEVNQRRAEDNATFLDSIWMRQQVQDEAERRWREQEIERVLDEHNGAPSTKPAATPPKIIGIREQARMQLLVERMMSHSQRLRDLAASNMDFGRRNAILLVRMHLVGVENIETTIPLERGKHTRALTEDAVLALREKIDDRSWNELVSYIDRLYVVTEAEAKNSDSQPEKRLLPSGSTEPSEPQASNGGNSTKSSFEPRPAAESEMTIAKSSGSTSDSATAPVSSPANDSPTAEV